MLNTEEIIEKITEYHIPAGVQEAIWYIIEHLSPIYFEGGIEQGKTVILLVIGDILITCNRKLLSLCDSPEMEFLQFAERGDLVWFIPYEYEWYDANTFQDRFTGEDRQIQFEYIDIEDHERIYKVLERSHADAFVGNTFTPLLIDDFCEEDFSHDYNLPPLALICIEMSTYFNQYFWYTDKSKAIGKLMRMIRHSGGNGFNFLGDMQRISQIPFELRSLDGIINVWKNCIIPGNSKYHVHKYLREYHPEIISKIARLNIDDFYIKIKEKFYRGKNAKPEFYIEKKQFKQEKYYTINSKRYPFPMRKRIRRRVEQLIKEKLSEKSEDLGKGKKMKPSEYEDFFR